MSSARRTLPAIAALSLAAALALSGCASAAPKTSATPSQTTTTTPTPTPAFDKSAHSIDDPNSIWVVSNKLRPLNPVEFAPSDLSMPSGVENEFTQPLREPAARAVEQLTAAAATAGVNLRIISAYRDSATQQSLYSKYVNRDGQAAADTYSARPGHSEHQTGLAVDFDDHGSCYLATCFADTAAGQWLATNAATYGFVLRYPNGAEATTGFQFEPWHFRYVGPELAAEMKRTNTITLEEFFGLPAAPGYAG